jgi:hypothetical protein
MKITEKKLPLNFKLISSLANKQKGAHENQTSAELPSVFLVNSQESSSPTGSIGIEHTPMTVEITNNGARLFRRTVNTAINKPSHSL